MQREFRRPIAYDVDYVYKGMKYRSRLPDDPGNRLRVRVSVMPHVAAARRAAEPSQPASIRLRLPRPHARIRAR